MTYSDIKRYDLDPTFLLKMAKLAIADQDWVIQEESNAEVVANVPKRSGIAAMKIKVKVRRGIVTIDCETDEPHFGNMENKFIGERFTEAFEKRISEVPIEMRRNLKETYCLSFR